MGVSHNFITGKSYIDGVEVTEENGADLVTANLRREVLRDLDALVRKTGARWPGVADCPERERILALLLQCESDIKGG